MFGYDGKPWTNSDSPKDRFEFDVSPPEEYGSLKEELPRTAKKIAELFPGETIHIMHGGGMDSEAILWGFRRAHVPFKPVCIVDTGGANKHELAHVATAEYYPVNLKQWLLSSECRSIAKEVQQSVCSMMFLSHTLLHHMRGKVVIVGFTEPEIEYKGVLSESEWFYAVWKLFFQYGVLGVPLFWSSFPELYYAYLQGLSSHRTKEDLYYTELGLRPRQKINWHNNIQYWGPRGIWRRRVFMSMNQMLARVDLGLA